MRPGKQTNTQQKQVPSQPNQTKQTGNFPKVNDPKHVPREFK
jgi:hypothetical protein